MFRIDHPTAVATLPTPLALGTQGYFTRGNPTGGVSATVLTADFANMVQESLMRFLTDAGVSTSKTDTGRLREACRILFGGGGTLAANGWQRLPGGLILQWGSVGWTAGALGNFGPGWTDSPPGVVLGANFPIAFPTALYSMVANGADVTGGSDGVEVTAAIRSATRFGAEIVGYRVNGGNGGGTDVGSFRYMAVGV